MFVERPFSLSPKTGRRSRKVSHPESHDKISSLLITELSLVHLFTYKKFQAVGGEDPALCFKKQELLNMALRARKTSGAFEQRAPVRIGLHRGFSTLIMFKAYNRLKAIWPLMSQTFRRTLRRWIDCVLVTVSDNSQLEFHVLCK